MPHNCDRFGPSEEGTGAFRRDAVPLPPPAPLLVAAVLLFLLLLPASGSGQAGGEVTRELLGEVMPEADRFSEKEGDPPVFRAYRIDPSTGEEGLLGYAFLTEDLPPVVMGYAGPVHVLVGMDLTGALTGVRVLWHREPLARSRLQFLEDPAYLRQFARKHVGEPFRLRLDLRGITGATVSVDAVALGVRNASRRVALAHLAGRPPVAEGERPAGAGPVSSDRVAELSWFELLSEGVMKRLVAEVDGMVRLEIFFTPLRDEAVAETLLGPGPFAQAMRRAGARASEGPLMFLGLEGQNLNWFRPSLFFVVQDSDTVRVSGDDVVLVRDLRGGRVAEQLGAAGLWMLDPSIDLGRPFTVGLGGDLGLTMATVEYPGGGAAAAVAAGPGRTRPDEATVDGARAPDERAPRGPPGGPSGEDGRAPEPTPEGPREEAPAAHGPDARGPAVAPEEAAPEDAAPGEALPATPGAFFDDAGMTLDFFHEEEESQFARTLARTSWTRVGGLALLLLAASLAFFTKSTRLRWLTLAATLLFLGFADRGFLSISHVTSGLLVGTGLFLSDLTLLLLVVFTVVTTLLWGRIFCGYLCPFGVLQDLLERFVPRRFQRRMPSWIHDRAIFLKYGVLALIVLPVLMQIAAPRVISPDLSLYHYFEPFGTVFYLSNSVLLWAIAVAFLAASAVVPRFYCRYSCPLGAGLAVVSRVSPFRIRRVEQCTLCKVCEQSCPTGAIRGHEVDFPECVRCSVCEVKLEERAGTCRHEMEEIRPRLARIRVPSA